MDYINNENHSKVIRDNLRLFCGENSHSIITQANSILSDYHYCDVLYYGLTKYPIKSKIKYLSANIIVTGYINYFIYNQYNINTLNCRHIILMLLYCLSDTQTISNIYYLIDKWIKYYYDRHSPYNIKIDIDIIKDIPQDISFSIINNLCYFFALSDKVIHHNIYIMKFIHSPKHILTYLNIKKSFTDKSKYYYDILYKLINKKIIHDDIILHIFSFF